MYVCGRPAKHSQWFESAAQNCLSLRLFAIICLFAVQTACSQFSLDSSFGKQVDQISSAEITSPLVPVNSANKSNYLVSGTCNAGSGRYPQIVIRAQSLGTSSTLNTLGTTSCENGQFSTNLNLESLADGPITVHLYSAQGERLINSGDLEKDTQAPTASLLSAPPAVNSLTAVSSFVGSTDTANFSFKVGPQGSTNCSLPAGYSTWSSVDAPLAQSLAAEPDGPIRLCLVARDRAGNAQPYSEATVIDWNKDTSVPTVILSGIPGAYTNLANFVATVGGSGVTHYRFKTGLASSLDCTSEVGYSAEAPIANGLNVLAQSGDASYRVCVIGKNAANTWQTPANATQVDWTYDTASPTITISSPSNGSFVSTVNQTSFPVSTSCSENGRAVEITATSLVDETTVMGTSNCTGGSSTINLNLSTLPEGTISLSANHSDLAGNTATSSTVSALRDVTAPSLSGVLADSFYFNSLSASPGLSWAAATDSGSGVAYYALSIGTSSGATDVEDWISIGNVLSHSQAGLSLADSTQYFPQVRAVDNAGNVSTALIGDGWITDMTAPDMSGLILSVPATGTTTLETPTLSWAPSATDLASGVSHYEVAIGSASGLTDIVSFTNIGSGSSGKLTGLSLPRGADYFASIRAVDVAGNVSAVVTGGSWNLPNLVSPLAISPTAMTLDVGQVWRFSASGGAPPYSYSKIGTGGTFDSNTGVLSIDDDGGYTVTIRVTDADGSTADSAVTVNPLPVINCDSPTSWEETYAARGIFYDSGGPTGNYLDWEYCGLTINVLGSELTLKFISLDTQVNGTYDSLDVWDINWTRLVRAQGTTLPADIVRPDGYLDLEFESDGTDQRAGFEVHWSSTTSTTPVLLLNGWTSDRSRHLGFVDASQSLLAIQGTGPYTFSIVSGAGSLTNVTDLSATFVPVNTLGTTVIRVTDAMGATSERTYTVYQDPFTLSSFTNPTWVTKAGGNNVWINGTGFLPGLTATVGGVPCTAITGLSSGGFNCATPPNTDGCHDVQVLNGDSIGTGTLVGRVCYRYGTWTSMPAPSTQARIGHAHVWTGDRLIIWGGQDPSCAQGTCIRNSGYVYDPLTDSWSAMAAAPYSVTLDPAGVWTGHEVLIYGGRIGGTVYNNGGKYNPYTNTWTSMSSPAWQPRQRFAQVWTGTEMILSGGQYASVRAESAAYNPSTNTWRLLPNTTGRWLHRAAWNGQKMLVFGGATGLSPNLNYNNTGNLYDPALNTWSSITTPNLRDKNFGFYAASQAHNYVFWTGDKFLVAGGDYEGGVTTGDFGGLYDPEANTWTNLTNYPAGGYSSSAVWTGTHLIQISSSANHAYRLSDQTVLQIESKPSTERAGLIWTGKNIIACYGYISNTSGGTCSRFDPGGLHNHLSGMTSDSWVDVNTTDAPSARQAHSSIWNGKYMITWGGHDGINYLNTGGRYDPFANSWLGISTTDAPSGRKNHTTLWSGSRMLVWGGEVDSIPTMTNSGGIYNANLDTWTAIDQLSFDTPSPRKDHTSIWTGTKMIVWGGHDGTSALADGGIFSINSNTWSAIATTDAPTARSRHQAIWTGAKMIIWGGHDGTAALNDGSIYDLATNTWTSMSTTDAPSARSSFAMIHVKNKVVIWGGLDSSGNPLGTGAIYDIATNAWTAISTTDAPSARSGMTAVFSDSSMIIHGGHDGATALSDAFKYNTQTNTWTMLSTTGAPSLRTSASAVWTGSVGDGRANGSGAYRNNTNGDTGRLIIWGGSDGMNPLADGKIYHLSTQ